MMKSEVLIVEKFSARFESFQDVKSTYLAGLQEHKFHDSCEPQLSRN